MKKFTTNFSYDEFMVSPEYPKVASGLQPSDHVCDYLYLICNNILQPARDNFEFTAFIITSAYRNWQLNTLVGGTPNSLHLQGKAVDFTTHNKQQLFAIYKYIKQNLRHTFSELVLYIDSETNEPVHIHVGLADWMRPKIIKKKTI